MGVFSFDTFATQNTTPLPGRFEQHGASILFLLED